MSVKQARTEHVFTDSDLSGSTQALNKAAASSSGKNRNTDTSASANIAISISSPDSQNGFRVGVIHNALWGTVAVKKYFHLTRTFSYLDFMGYIIGN
jgi:hypothetical protein